MQSRHHPVGACLRAKEMVSGPPTLKTRSSRWMPSPAGCTQLWDAYQATRLTKLHTALPASGVCEPTTHWATTQQELGEDWVGCGANMCVIIFSSPSHHHLPRVINTHWPPRLNYLCSHLPQHSQNPVSRPSRRTSCISTCSPTSCFLALKDFEIPAHSSRSNRKEDTTLLMLKWSSRRGHLVSQAHDSQGTSDSRLSGGFYMTLNLVLWILLSVDWVTRDITLLVLSPLVSHPHPTLWLTHMGY